MQHTLVLELKIGVAGPWPGDDDACQAVVERLAADDILLGESCVLSFHEVVAEVLAAPGDSR